MIFLNDKENPWGKKPSGENRGNGDRPNPWGAGGNGGGRSNGNGVDDAIDMMQRKFKQRFGGGGGGSDKDNGSGFSPRAFTLGVVAILGFWASSGFFRVQEGELGVVLRFGEMVRVATPGLQYHIPAPFEQVIIRNVSAVNMIDGGLKGNNNSDASDQTLILTGDENMVHTNYTVQWRIKDVAEFLFNAPKPELTIKIAAESVIREIIGQTQARLALTEGRDKIGTLAQEHLQKLLDGYKLGVQVISVQLQSVAPPQEVIDFFNDVQASLIDADRERNAAEAYRNDKLPRAGGQAKQIVAEAEGYRGTKIPEAEGEAARFTKILDSLKGTNRDILMKRQYFETMQTVLGKTQKVIVDPKTGQGVLPYLPLPNMKKATAEGQH